MNTLSSNSLPSIPGSITPSKTLLSSRPYVKECRPQSNLPPLSRPLLETRSALDSGCSLTNSSFGSINEEPNSQSKAPVEHKKSESDSEGIVFF